MKKKKLLKGVQVIVCILSALFIINCSSDDGTATVPVKPEIIVTGNIVDFGAIDVLSHSSSQSIQVKGLNLTANLTLDVPVGFEVSIDDTTFNNQVIINKDDANGGDTMVYVRFSPGENLVGNNTGTLSLQSAQATTLNIALSGEGVSITPVINVDGTINSFDDTTLMQNSLAKTIVINGDNLESEITVVTSAGFQVSLDDATYLTTLQIPTASVNDDTAVYVRFTPDAIGTINGTLTLSNADVSNDVVINLSGNGIPVVNTYTTFNQTHLAFGGGANQFSIQNFMLHSDMSNIETIKMYVKLECPTGGCNAWDVFAHIQVKDTDSGEWYEIGRYITPYGVDNSQLNRGFEIDVTDFKSLLQGNVELRAYIEVWGADGWNVSVDFDYIEGTPDYQYYAVSRVFQYNQNSLEGVVYGQDDSAFDLTKTITIPANAESSHLRTIISGWGHATPVDSDNRPCAEWCFRTHDVKINGANTFQHQMEPIGCASNPVSPQNGNWIPDRAGWCPGMAVPVRIDDLGAGMSGNTFDFEYDYEDWITDGGTTSGQTGAYYATSTYVVVKSNSMIVKPTIME